MLSLEISWAGTNTSLSSLCLKKLLSNSPKLTFALMSLCNDSTCILLLKWKATAIIQLLGFPQTRAIKLPEKKNSVFLTCPYHPLGFRFHQIHTNSHIRCIAMPSDESHNVSFLRTEANVSSLALRKYL